jgi:hypothetical protein
MRNQFLIIFIMISIFGCSSSKFIPLSVPYKFNGHEINNMPQSIHYEYQNDSVTIVYFDSLKTVIVPGQPAMTTRWESFTAVNSSPVKYPSVISKVQPLFPQIAQRAGVTGKVIAKALIRGSGPPSKVIVMQSGAEIFNQPVIEAVLQWNFQSSGPDQPIQEFWAVLEFDFILKNGPKVIMPY